MSEHVVIDTTRIRYANNKLSQDVGSLAKTDVYGMKNCGKTWGAILAKHLIIDVLECTEGKTLSQCEVDCLQGKLSEDLALNCC